MCFLFFDSEEPVWSGGVLFEAPARWDSLPSARPDICFGMFFICLTFVCIVLYCSLSLLCLLSGVSVLFVIRLSFHGCPSFVSLCMFARLFDSLL